LETPPVFTSVTKNVRDEVGDTSKVVWTTFLPGESRAGSSVEKALTMTAELVWMLDEQRFKLGGSPAAGLVVIVSYRMKSLWVTSGWGKLLSDAIVGQRVREGGGGVGE
jgi:hypothetical protein